VRPLKLRFNGLRSYRTEQEVDFTDVGLMAIVGDTGAGKSSLLEGICFALYGGCTWDHRSATPLIADGTTTLRVELSFRCRNKTWRVTRAISRNSYPPAVHQLECLDDGTRCDSKEQVNNTIEKMIGLDFNAFLKAVILPQGRFQALLQTTGAERTGILKSILGLDDLAAVRELAAALHDRMGPQLQDLQDQRHELFTDPGAEASVAGEQVRATAQRADALRQAKTTVTAARLAQYAATHRAEQIGIAATRLQQARAADAAAGYRTLAATDNTINNALTATTDQLAEAQQREHALKTSVDAAEADGRGPTVLATTITTLHGMIEQLPDLDAERGQVTRLAEAVAADHETLLSQRVALIGLNAAADEAATLARGAEDAASAAEEAVRRGRRLLDDARAAAQARLDADAAITATHDRVGEWEQKMDEATREAAAAAAEQSATEAELEAVRRAHAAAHAASVSRPGDPCPVCARELPEYFVTPTPPGEDAARAGFNAAKRKAKAADGALHTTTANLDNARTAAADAQTQATRRSARLDQILAQLHQTIGDVDLSRSDDQLLIGLDRSTTKALAALEAAREEARTRRDTATAATATLQHADTLAKDRSDELATARRRLGGRTRRFTKTVDSLPAAYRAPQPLTVDALQAQLGKARGDQAAISTTTNDLETARDAVARLRQRREELRQQHLVEVERPAQAIRRRVDAAADRAAEAADLLGKPRPPDQQPTSISGEATWADDIDATASTLLSICQRERADLQTAAHDEDAKAAQALAMVGATNPDELEQAFIDASAAAQNAEQHLRIAEAQVPIAADLDRRITTAKPVVDGLREVDRLLADGKFPAVVVARKQRALLGLATDLLRDMTARRFAFSDDFRIIDAHTSQPRDVKTLSGGETFLASLALALAVVELAGRSGGRIEALFLDEGFGSLDANSLADALDALAAQTVGGRLVAVISHMHAVAENIERVLVVSRGTRGSRVHWAPAAERDQLVADELAAGLLA